MFRSLCLSAILLICFSVPTVAVPVDPNAPDEVAAILGAASNPPRLLRTNGEVYRYDYDLEEWYRDAVYDSPVPVAEIADWWVGFLITQSGDWWFENPGAGGTWEMVVLPPWLLAPVNDGTPAIPTTPSNYPNPFNPTTLISFELMEAQLVKVEVYTVAGELVNTLVDEGLSIGAHEIIWDGRNKTGDELPSGVYIYRLEAGPVVSTGKMALVR